MKAENINGAAQMLEAPIGQNAAAIGDQGFYYHRQIGQQFAAVVIGRRVADGLLWGVDMPERLRRRRGRA